MDLLGDLGSQDQLESARLELAAAKAATHSLSMELRLSKQTVEALSKENEALKSENAVLKEMVLESSSSSSLPAAPHRNVPTPLSPGASHTLQPTSTFPSPHKPHCLCVTHPPSASYVITGGSDSKIFKTLYGLYTETGDVLPSSSSSSSTPSPSSQTFMGELSSPVLLLASDSTHVYASCMAGTVNSCPLSPPHAFTPLQFKHSKTPTALLLTSTHLLSSSNDASLHVHDIAGNATQTHKFPSPITAAACTDTDVYLYLVSISMYTLSSLSSPSPQPSRSIHLNDRPFDNHQSFSVLWMSLSSSHLSVTTDASRTQVYDLKTLDLAKNLYGHATGAFSTARSAFDPTGTLLLVTDDDENALCCVEVQTGDVRWR